MPYLMCRTKEVLYYELKKGFVESLEIINAELAPEQLKTGQTGALERWFSERCVDLSRANARLLLKQFHLSNSKTEIVLANKALTLTDSYWIKDSEAEKYNRFNLYRQETDRCVQFASLSGEQGPISRHYSPELTNLGSFDKAWFRLHGEWHLAKTGSFKSKYAELFTHHLGKQLGFKMAQYKYNDPYLYSRNFTNEAKMLEHYASFRYRFDHIEIEEGIVLQNLKEVNLHEEYLNILLLDAIVNNVDRHEFNFGVLKDSKTGKLLGLAPNYDNNLAFGGPSALSPLQLQLHVDEFGIPDYQKDFFHGLSFKQIEGIDELVRTFVDPPDLTRHQVIAYFQKVLKMLHMNG